MSVEAGGPAVDEKQLGRFLASVVFVVPWISWQAWVLGATLRQRRGFHPAAPAASAGTGSSDGAAPPPDDSPFADHHQQPQGPLPDEASSSPTIAASRWRPIVFTVGVSLLFLFAQSWLGRVLTFVPEPYLDEVFHIPQAQKYCEGKWNEWDNKITTPPGLYLVSVLYKGLWTAVDGCSVWALRGANNIAIMLVAVAACSCRTEIEHQAQLRHQQQRHQLARHAAKQQHASSSAVTRAIASAGTSLARSTPRKLSDSIFSLYAFHTALNVALFPVLFFFSALYYTDVYASLAVLLAYRNHLYRLQYHDDTSEAAPPLWSGLLTVVLGVATLLLRQTNVFWVVVYMGGVEAVRAIKTQGRRARTAADAVDYVGASGAASRLGSILSVAHLYAWRYSLGDIHDPPLGEAWPDDWAVSLLSVGVATLFNPGVVLLQIWPYLTVLASFVAFVGWNGSVVLGDKSNHVATLHLAQLLYIWPLFVFFSAPLLVSHAVLYLRQGLARAVGSQAARDEKDTPASASASASTAAPERQTQQAAATAGGGAKTKEELLPASTAPSAALLSVALARAPGKPGRMLRLLHALFVQKTYYPLFLVLVFDAMVAIVRFSTIVHPFTLADNRHYMFYVFRYSIRRGIFTRYALIPTYAACAWACCRILWGRHPAAGRVVVEFVNSPFAALQTTPGLVVDSKGGDKKEAGLVETGRRTPPPPQKEAHAHTNKTQKQKKRRGGGATKTETPSADGGGDGNSEAQDNVYKGNDGDDQPAAVFLSFLDESPSCAAAMEGPTTTTALLWLLATALSLVTAPLVEPRYFILPWIFWRLLVPAVPTVEEEEGSQKEDGPGPANRGQEASFVLALGCKVDVRLVLETAWFCTINAATMYVFLMRPFVWRAADGSLIDEGRLQRFMW